MDTLIYSNKDVGFSSKLSSPNLIKAPRVNNGKSLH